MKTETHFQNTGNETLIPGNITWIKKVIPPPAFPIGSFPIENGSKAIPSIYTPPH